MFNNNNMEYFSKGASSDLKMPYMCQSYNHYESYLILDSLKQKKRSMKYINV